MKVRHIIRGLFNGVKNPFFANEEVANEQVLTLSANFANGEDGWVQLTPYGDFDNSGGMQRVRREDAQAIVDNFKSLGNVATQIMGLPWYIGHPDHENFKSRYTDTRAYGRIKELEARSDGLYANVKWTRKGKEMINEGEFHGHSTNWKVRKDGAAWRPYLLKSVGFTNEPNIPVKPILVANEQELANQTTAMLKKLIDYLKLKPEATEADVESAVLALANEKTLKVPNWLATLMKKPAATEDEARTFINEAIGHKDPLDACHSELAGYKQKQTANEATIVTLNGKITTLTNERDTARTNGATLQANFANERKARITDLIGYAIVTGRITAAEKAGWETDLANEETFTVKATALGALKPKIHTQSMVNVAERNTQVIDRNTQLTNLVNEEMKNNGGDYDAAWAKVKDKNKALFEQMVQPEHSRAQAQR